ncbi:MAG: phage tail protein [Bacteroidota bacterium]
MATTNVYPPVSFYFKVNFTGGGISAETSFKEVSGLTVDIEVDEVVEGGNLQFRHRLPKTPKYPDLVLKRGLVTDSSLRTWMEKAINEFTFTPIVLTVQLLNEQGSPTMSWTVHNARPLKWEISRFDSQSNELALESITLAYDYFEMKTGS